MKKSVIAAVAASNLTVFSGLVNAANPEDYKDCTLYYINSRNELITTFDDGTNIVRKTMVVRDFVAGSCDGTVPCSVYYKKDPQDEVIRHPDGRIKWFGVTANCITGQADESDYVTCLVNNPTPPPV